MYVQIVTFQLKGLSGQDYLAACNQLAPTIAQVPGLRYWLPAPDTHALWPEKAFVADMVPARKRGTAYGFYNLAFGITVFPASLLFGLVWDQYGATSAFLASSAISVAAIAFFATSIRSSKVVH